MSVSPLKHVVGSPFDADFLFPSEEDGKNVTPSVEAVALARGLLDAPEGADLVWDLPDVFSVAYSSTLIGSASFDGRKVEFFFED